MLTTSAAGPKCTICPLPQALSRTDHKTSAAARAKGEARRKAPPSPSEAQGAEGGLRVGVGGSDVTKPTLALPLPLR
jgi:hypothetical protein